MRPPSERAPPILYAPQVSDDVEDVVDDVIPHSKSSSASRPFPTHATRGSMWLCSVPSKMPRATSERLSRVHQAAVKSNAAKDTTASSSGVRNPIFNTERFGQHILKNPLVAQGYVCSTFSY